MLRSILFLPMYLVKVVSYALRNRIILCVIISLSCMETYPKSFGKVFSAFNTSTSLSCMETLPRSLEKLDVDVDVDELNKQI